MTCSPKAICIYTVLYASFLIVCNKIWHVYVRIWGDTLLSERLNSRTKAWNKSHRQRQPIAIKRTWRNHIKIWKKQSVIIIGSTCIYCHKCFNIDNATVYTTLSYQLTKQLLVDLAVWFQVHLAFSWHKQCSCKRRRNSWTVVSFGKCVLI